MLSGVRIWAHRIPASTKGVSSRVRAMTWPALLSALAVFLIASLVTPTVGQDKSGTLRFGVGPLQPTPTETKKAYEPFFAYLAKQLNRDFDLVATTDWAGISVALSNRQVDLAWMGDRKSTRLNSSHGYISYAVFCLKKKKINNTVNLLDK